MTEQTIQFLLCARKRAEPDSWEFPGKQTLKKLFDHGVNTSGDPDVLNVALGSHVDDQGFPIITLSTVNMTLFNRFRQSIRTYNDDPGYIFDTYAKEEFMEKRTVSIYISRRFARFSPQIMLQALINDYPVLCSEYTILHRHIFDENIPGRPKREGDAILILGGPQFLEKMSYFPEEYVFHINAHWRFTIRGGPRKTHSVSSEDIERIARDRNYSREFAKSIIPGITI